MSERKPTQTTRSERYIIDGKEYHSLSDVPEAQRKKLEAHLKLLEDKDKDGTPDIFQRNGARTSRTETKVVHVSSGDNAETAGEILKKVLQQFGGGPFAPETQDGENKSREGELPSVRRHRDDQRKETIRNYLGIAALIAVIVLLALTLF